MGCAGEIDRAHALDSATGEATDARHDGRDATNGAGVNGAGAEGDTRGGATPRDSNGSSSGASSTGASGSNGAPSDTTNVCDREASWSAHRDLAFERTTGDFSAVLNELLRHGDDAAIAVSSHMDPGCAWMVAFSAVTAMLELESHPASFAPMLRHPAGLWTTAPQTIGWMRVVDAAERVAWLPLADITGAATYEQVSCASLSSVDVAATIPPSAGDLSIATATGERTIRDLMGAEPSARGWDIRFAFSAELSR
jgi:hypothetical protein